MRHVKLLSIIAIVAFIFALITMYSTQVGAQPLDGDREGNQDAREDIREIRRDEIEGTLKDRLVLRGENVLSRATMRSDRLVNAQIKLAQIAEKLKNEGKDTSAVDTALTAAVSAQTQAQTSLSDAQATLSSIKSATEREAIKQLVQEFKTQVKAAYTSLHTSRESLIAAIKAIKDLKTTIQ